MTILTKEEIRKMDIWALHDKYFAYSRALKDTKNINEIQKINQCRRDINEELKRRIRQY